LLLSCKKMTTLLVFLLVCSVVSSFVVTPSFGGSSTTTSSSTPFFSRRRWGMNYFRAASSSSSIIDDSTSVVSTTTTTKEPPSWDELLSSLLLLQEQHKEEEVEEEPLVTLYRDTNGWCPFCERVWLALRVKGIPYRERLINLQDKPEWFTELVPTALVPALLIHNSNTNSTNNERRILWESQDILKALDEEFPDTPQLLLNDNDNNAHYYDAAMKLNDELQSAGFKYIYGNKNQTTTTERQQNRHDFLTKLDQLNAALEQNPPGSFRLGTNTVTAMDCVMIPTLERWRYQLPLTEGLDILENRPFLRKWLDVMDSYPPYADRVRGDAYSWTAATSTFLRLFASNDDQPETTTTLQEKIERADAATNKLTESFGDAVVAAVAVDPVFAREAATKLITNHDAVVADCTTTSRRAEGEEPNVVKSQTQLPRASDTEAADFVLRHVASLLLLHNDDDDDTKSIILAAAQSGPLPITKQHAAAASEAARTVAARLCVPRDMSAPAAAIFRTVLTIVANRYSDTSKQQQ